jgi:hypothetical protein
MNVLCMCPSHCPLQTPHAHIVCISTPCAHTITCTHTSHKHTHHRDTKCAYSQSLCTHSMHTHTSRALTVRIPTHHVHTLHNTNPARTHTMDAHATCPYTPHEQHAMYKYTHKHTHALHVCTHPTCINPTLTQTT